MIDSNIITALSALSRYDVKLKRKGLNTPDFLPKAPRHRSKLLHISNTLRIYKSTGSLRRGLPFASRQNLADVGTLPPRIFF